jgi:hypothetical protein
MINGCGVAARLLMDALILFLETFTIPSTRCSKSGMVYCCDLSPPVSSRPNANASPGMSVSSLSSIVPSLQLRITAHD